MNYEYVRVEKIATSEDPLVEAGNSDLYPYGSHFPETSLPISYWLEGWLVGKPAVGRPMVVLRLVRNGVEALGLFTSSVVTEVRGANLFCTLNSVYRWTPLGVIRWPRMRDLPEEERASFSIWLVGSAMPVVEGVPPEQQDFFYPWDFLAWRRWLLAQDDANSRN